MKTTGPSSGNKSTKQFAKPDRRSPPTGANEHPHVTRVFSLDWDLLEPILDDPTHDHIRFRVFDADDLAYRFRIIAYLTSTGTIRLIEFDLFE